MSGTRIPLGSEEGVLRGVTSFTRRYVGRLVELACEHFDDVLAFPTAAQVRFFLVGGWWSTFPCDIK